MIPAVGTSFICYFWHTLRRELPIYYMYVLNDYFNSHERYYGSGCTKTNQFFGETKRISENTRKQPIIALGLLNT